MRAWFNPPKAASDQNDTKGHLLWTLQCTSSVERGGLHSDVVFMHHSDLFIIPVDRLYVDVCGIDVLQRCMTGCDFVQGVMIFLALCLFLLLLKYIIKECEKLKNEYVSLQCFLVISRSAHAHPFTNNTYFSVDKP